MVITIANPFFTMFDEWQTTDFLSAGKKRSKWEFGTFSLWSSERQIERAKDHSLSLIIDLTFNFF